MATFLEKIPWRTIATSLAILIAALAASVWVCLAVDPAAIYARWDPAEVLLAGVVLTALSIAVTILRIFVFRTPKDKPLKKPIEKNSERWS